MNLELILIIINAGFVNVINNNYLIISIHKQKKIIRNLDDRGSVFDCVGAVL